MNFAATLKAEITRLARKELRTEIQGLKKSSAQHRSDIAALKRRIADLEKALRHAARQTRESAPPPEEGVKLRFSAQRLGAQRARLGLSAADFGALIGVSGQTVYKWEKGESRPRSSQLQAIHAARKLGKREALAKLAER